MVALLGTKQQHLLSSTLKHQELCHMGKNRKCDMRKESGVRHVRKNGREWGGAEWGGAVMGGKNEEYVSSKTCEVCEMCGVTYAV